ncbi:MAG: Shedu anti-phage system protein SduA domain-containing protein [Candidatus Woesearchaeota archaeon]
MIEIKRPDGKLKFWNKTKDHGNYIHTSNLVKAIMQSIKYIYEVERKANDLKFHNRVDNVKIIKPRCALIFGRSNDWNNDHKEAYRILNFSFHNLTILTYDYVLERAERINSNKYLNDSFLTHGQKIRMLQNAAEKGENMWVLYKTGDDWYETTGKVKRLGGTCYVGGKPIDVSYIVEIRLYSLFE